MGSGIGFGAKSGSKTGSKNKYNMSNLLYKCFAIFASFWSSKAAKKEPNWIPNETPEKNQHASQLDPELDPKGPKSKMGDRLRSHFGFVFGYHVVPV